MPYKDPARQREYLRTWRRNQKLRTSRTPAQHIVHSEPAYHRKFPTQNAANGGPADTQNESRWCPTNRAGGDAGVLDQQQLAHSSPNQSAQHPRPPTASRSPQDKQPERGHADRCDAGGDGVTLLLK